MTGSIDRCVTWITLVCAWFSMAALIAVTSLDVAVRQIAHVGSDTLKEIESFLFLTLVMTSLGHAYLQDGHVRIDILRERMSPRTRAWVEVVGCVAVLIPLCAILVYHGFDAALSSYAGGERLETLTDLPVQWVVKATVPTGYLLLLVAGISVTFRNILFLLGKVASSAPGASSSGEPLVGIKPL